MNYSVVTFPQFDKDVKRLAKKYPSIKSDLKELEAKLSINPRIGDEVVPDCYKIRLAISSKNKGKSGGARVISYVIVKESTVILLTIYDKSEKETVSIGMIKKMLENINDE